MAGLVIPQELPIGKEWEEELYRRGCALMQQEAQEKLEALEEWLHARAPEGWQVVGFRERTVVCRFGEVTVRRRLYCDEEGCYHFLVDEYLGWESYQSMTPSLEQAVVIVGAKNSFREAAEVVELLTAGAVSAMTVQRRIQATAEKAQAQERAEVAACFERGEMVAGGKREVSRLFVEADGLHVRLQRAGGAHEEIRTAVAYEGWERLAGTKERYRLVGKRVYCQADERIDFWEGAALAFGRTWNWERITEVVLNGDGAAWIDKGVLIGEKVIRQLDGFHLARSCYQAVRESGAELYQAVRKGEWTTARDLLEQARPARERQRGWLWIRKVIAEQRGADWRSQAGLAEEVGRGLGTMEGNEAQIWARRLKGKGMSWSRKGARNMGKVLELVTNGEIGQWCGRPVQSPRPQQRPAPQRTKRRQSDPAEWLQASLPALRGPAAAQPWVQALRQLAHPPDLLN